MRTPGIPVAVICTTSSGIESDTMDMATAVRKWILEDAPWLYHACAQARARVRATLNLAARPLWRAKYRDEPARYSILPGYRHRGKILYFDDTKNTDQWQREVYEFARCVMREYHLRRIYDVGCGSGYKLVRYLGEYETVGFDMPETVAFLQQRYPARCWDVLQQEASYPPPDLIICADVIEHVENPDELLDAICALQPTWVVLSTPNRDMVYFPWQKYYLGPPRNSTHLREWNKREFASYLSPRFATVKHFVCHAGHATQLVFAWPKPGQNI